MTKSWSVPFPESETEHDGMPVFWRFQAAIEAERRKAQEEAERIRREAEAKEQARIAEEKRIKEEEECRAKDKAHRKEVNNKILADLIKVGASEDVAKNIITAIVKGEVFATKITY